MEEQNSAKVTSVDVGGAEVATKEEKPEDLDMWAFKGVVVGEVKTMKEDPEKLQQDVLPAEVNSKRDDVDELEQESEEDCEQELPQFIIRTMCKVVAEVVCNECGREYATVAKLKKHMYCSHWYRRERNKKCDWPNCVKTFFDKSKLEEHKRTHTGEKPLKCLEPGCNKSFRKKSTLQAHKLVHSGEKPHQCLEPGCNKTFRQKIDLRVHKTTHTGEKPYRCSAANCGKAYTNPSTLSKHKKTQHKGMLQDQVEVEEQVPAHEEVHAGGGEEFVNNEGGVKEEVVEEKDGAKWGGMEEDPLRILPEELIFEGEGLVNEEVMEMEVKAR